MKVDEVDPVPAGLEKRLQERLVIPGRGATADLDGGVDGLHRVVERVEPGTVGSGALATMVGLVADDPLADRVARGDVEVLHQRGGISGTHRVGDADDRGFPDRLLHRDPRVPADRRVAPAGGTHHAAAWITWVTEAQPDPRVTHTQGAEHLLRGRVVHVERGTERRLIDTDRVPVDRAGRGAEVHVHVGSSSNPDASAASTGTTPRCCVETEAPATAQVTTDTAVNRSPRGHSCAILSPLISPVPAATRSSRAWCRDRVPLGTRVQVCTRG